MTDAKLHLLLAFAKAWLTRLALPSLLTSVLVAVVAAAGCEKEDPPVRGQLMVVLQTDMSLPKDVTQVKILVKRGGTPYHDKNYVIAPGENWVTKLPATLAVVASVDDPTPVVEVTVVGLRRSDARVFAQAVTTIPENRTATLFVPIQWLCDESVRTLPGNAGYASSCDPVNGRAQACRTGRCVDVRVDEEDLEDYDPSDVFGGADDPKDGLCFPTVECFASGFRVNPDEKCIVEVPVPEGLQVNFALFNPANGDGICNSDATRCYIPLDQDADFGWRYVKGSSASSNPVRAQLPPAVCDKLTAGDIEAVHATWDCNVKRLKFPTCGPWSAVSDGFEPDDGPVNPAPVEDAGTEIEIPPSAQLVIGFADPGTPVEIGRPVQLQLTIVLAADAGTTDVTEQATWSSSDELIASVVGGLVTGHKTGTVEIRAEVAGASALFNVTVERGTPESLEVQGSEEGIPAGLTGQLTVQANYPLDNSEDATEIVTWTSSDETVATVDQTGLVNALAEGVTTITVELNGASREVELTVVPPVLQRLEFDPQPVNLGGGRYQIIVWGTYSDGSRLDVTEQVTWQQEEGQQYGTLDTETGIITAIALVPEGERGVLVRVSLDGREARTYIRVTPA